MGVLVIRDIYGVGNILMIIPLLTLDNIMMIKIIIYSSLLIQCILLFVNFIMTRNSL